MRKEGQEIKSGTGSEETVPLVFNQGTPGEACPDRVDYSADVSTGCSLLRIFQIVRSERLMLYFWAM